MRLELVTPTEHIKYSIALAIQGARLSKKSLGKSDSNIPLVSNNQSVVIGENDLKLAKKLAQTPISGGHDKFLQSISFMVDITWARYMWQEFDTYRVGVSKQGESTIYTLLTDVENLQVTDFEVEIWDDCEYIEEFIAWAKKIVSLDIPKSNKILKLKKCLPESYMQKRRVSMNYAVMKLISSQRKNHFQPEWNAFITYMSKKLPYSELFIPQETHTNE